MSVGNKLSFGTKNILSYILLLCLMAAVGGISLWQMSDLIAVLANAEQLEESQFGLKIVDAKNQAKEALSLLQTVLLLSLVLGGFMAYILNQLLTRPVSKTVKVIKAMANGDLTQECEVDNNDAMGQQIMAINSMGTSLREIVRQIAKNTKKLSASSMLLLDTSNRLSDGTD